jgi:hypothetical protein
VPGLSAADETVFHECDRAAGDGSRMVQQREDQAASGAREQIALDVERMNTSKF